MNFKSLQISALGSIGGQDTKHVTWNILSHIFCDSVAKKISWKGANGKMAFKQMALRAVLAREYIMHKHATRQTVQFVEKSYFFLRN